MGALVLQLVSSSYLVIEPAVVAAISAEAEDAESLLPAPAEAAEPTSSVNAAAAGAGAGTPGEEQNAGFDGSEVHPSAGRLSVGDRVKVSCLSLFNVTGM